MSATSIDLSQIKTDALSAASTFRTLIGLGTSATLNAGSANGVATLGADSKLTAAQIPDISLISYLGSVASQAAMLALTGQQGDWCVRSDLSTTWVITGSDPTQIGNWTQLSYPSVPVQSVFGRTGAVVGVSTDYSAVGITNTAIGASNPSTGAFTTLSTTGRITTPSILLSGNFSSTAWTTSGVGLSHTTRTLTDTSSTGTVATAYTNVLGGNTIAASNATTFTDYASLFIGSPSAGSNVTITNALSLITQGAARFGGVIDTVNTQSTPLIRFNAAHPAVYFYAPYTWAIRLQNNTDTMEWGLSEIVAYKTLRLQSSLSFTTDLFLHRDAAGILAQRNGTSAQTYRIYNTYTDANNYERAKIAWSSNVLQIGTEKLGTGSARALELQTDGTTRLTIGTDGNTSLNSGKVVIGRSSFAAYGGTQPKLEIYGTNISSNDADGATLGLYGTGSTIDTGAAIALGCVYYGSTYATFARIRAAKKTDGEGNFSGGMVFETRDQSAANTGLTEKMRISSLGLVSFGGTTSSFPAIKRNSAALNFRLADDSADCDITAKAATFSGNVTVSAVNLVTDTTTGTKIGTGTTQKLGFYNATPVVQPAAVADATDAASVITQLNLLLARMRDLGLIAT